MTHGEILRGAVEASGLRQRELAKRLGVIPTRLHNWIAGRTPPPPEMLPALCRELGMDVAAARRFYAACGVDLEPVLGSAPT